MITAAPIPVPRATSITSRYPRAAPNLASAQAEAFASFSTTTSRPRRSSTRCLSGSSRQARFGADSMVGRALSANPGAPKPNGPAPPVGDPIRGEGLGPRVGDGKLGPRRAGRRGRSLQFGDDPAVFVDNPRRDFRATDINADGERH